MNSLQHPPPLFFFEFLKWVSLWEKVGFMGVVGFLVGKECHAVSFKKIISRL